MRSYNLPGGTTQRHPWWFAMAVIVLGFLRVQTDAEELWLLEATYYEPNPKKLATGHGEDGIQHYV